MMTRGLGVEGNDLERCLQKRLHGSQAAFRVTAPERAEAEFRHRHRREGQVIR